MKAILVDAYDSFVFTIGNYLRTMGLETLVVRNDAISAEGIRDLAPHFVVLGPGPGHPADSGYVPIIDALRGRIPILGVCLGQQAIGLAHGGTVAQAGNVRHGKTSLITHDGQGMFRGIPSPFSATRYHSLIVEKVPDSLVVTARSGDDGHVMGLRNRDALVESVQFHPESVATQRGLRLMENFIREYVNGDSD